MKPHKAIEYKIPIKKALKELGGSGTSEQIYNKVKKYITPNDEDLQLLVRKDKTINYTISRNMHSHALRLLLKEKAIERVKDYPKTYKLLI